MFRSTSLRLAALYTGAFAFSVVVLALITLFTTRRALEEQFDSRIRVESAALAQEYKSEGLNGVLQAVQERDRTPGGLDYGLREPGGAGLAGRLARAPAAIGWSVLRDLRGPNGEPIRVLAVGLPDGYVLLVGDDEAGIEALEAGLFRGFAWAFVSVVILGVAGGYALSRDVNRRLAAISSTAEAIIDGDLSRRIPVRQSDDDLNRVALTINRMLDRIAALMESLKQVSNDIAHDLRTPLTRLRNKLEVGLTGPPDLDGALADLDAILDTFAALLRIAQIESGARRAAFSSCDLSRIAETVVEAFAPAAEDLHQQLSLTAPGPLPVYGDHELLTQMLVNLVENALRHAGPNACVEVRIGRLGQSPSLSVIDNGPGVPVGERERLFDRFYRLERSRSTPGNGLGLALVAAVAKLHGGEVRLLEAEPGLEARVTFAPAARA